MPSLAPTHVPSAFPSAVPTNYPTTSPKPSVEPTNGPTITSKTHFSETTYILSDVPGVLPAKQLVIFTTVTKEVVQSFVDKEEAKIDILYVEVLDQQFSEANGERRYLKNGGNGILQIKMKIAAEISPGNFPGYPELVDFILLSTETDKEMEAKLKKTKDFYDFKPVSAQGNGVGGRGDERNFSNGAVAGIAISCIASVALLFYHGRRTHVRVQTRMAGSFTDESGDAILRGSSDDSSSGAFGGKSSYVPRDWNASSPQSIGDESRFTTFSTNAVLGGNSNGKKRSFAKKMFRRSGRDSPTQANEIILHDLERNIQDNINLERNIQDSISITQTSSDIVNSGMCCSVVQPNCPTDNSMMAPVQEESNAHFRTTYDGTIESEDTLDEMTAIETILETPSDEHSSNIY